MLSMRENENVKDRTSANRRASNDSEHTDDGNDLLTLCVILATFESHFQMTLREAEMLTPVLGSTPSATCGEGKVGYASPLATSACKEPEPKTKPCH
eukprot:1804132-Amphidinium_carterae.1